MSKGKHKMNKAQKIAMAQRVLDKLNNRFHDAMEEAMQTYTAGMPLNLLALFFGVQVGLICKSRPEFKQMVISELNKHGFNWLTGDINAEM